MKLEIGMKEMQKKLNPMFHVTVPFKKTQLFFFETLSKVRVDSDGIK